MTGQLSDASCWVYGAQRRFCEDDASLPQCITPTAMRVTALGYTFSDFVAPDAEVEYYDVPWLTGNVTKLRSGFVLASFGRRTSPQEAAEFASVELAYSVCSPTNCFEQSVFDVVGEPAWQQTVLLQATPLVTEVVLGLGDSLPGTATDWSLPAIAGQGGASFLDDLWETGDLTPALPPLPPQEGAPPRSAGGHAGGTIAGALIGTFAAGAVATVGITMFLRRRNLAEGKGMAPLTGIEYCSGELNHALSTAGSAIVFTENPCNDARPL